MTIIKFIHTQQPSWKSKRDKIIEILDKALYRAARLKKDFEIEFRRIDSKRSNNQLRSYWRLINIVMNWMNYHGNNFTNDQVSDVFKIKAGHFIEHDSIKIPKSIANGSYCTSEQMNKIIQCILEFGIEHEIEDCEIDNVELDALLKFYEEK